MSNETIDTLLSIIPIVRRWASAVEAEALKRALDGVEFDHFRLVESRTNRKFLDLVAVKSVFEGHEIDPDTYAPRSIISAPQAETLFRRKAPEVWEDLLPLVFKPRGNPTLAPLDDPRPDFIQGSEFVGETENATEKS